MKALSLACIVVALAAGAAGAQVCQTNNPVCPIGGYTNVGCPVATDEVIQSVVASRIAGLSLPDRSCVNVSVKNGQVTLTGVADNASQRGLATIMATSVRGVTCVDNRMTIWQIGSADLAIVAAVRRVLDKQPFVTKQISISSDHGIVTLRGMVYSELAMQILPTTVYSVSGVQAVHNNLTLVSPNYGY